MKKLFALLLVLVMAFSMIGCQSAPAPDNSQPPSGSNDNTDTPGTVYNSGVRRITVFNNNMEGMSAVEQVWASGSQTMYNGYSLKEYVEKNLLIQPPADTEIMMVAGTDFYGQNVDLETFLQLYLALEGSDRVPITCGEANNKAKNPFNIQMILIGDEVILLKDVGKNTVGDWLFYLKENGTPFVEADNYEVVKADGSTATISKADFEKLNIADFKSAVPVGFEA